MGIRAYDDALDFMPSEQDTSTAAKRDAREPGLVASFIKAIAAAHDYQAASRQGLHSNEAAEMIFKRYYR